MITKNCEHLANMFVCGVNFSEQIEKNKDKFPLEIATASAVGGEAGVSIFNLRDKIRSTNNLLGKKTNWETEKYEIKYLQGVPPKENCRLM